MFLILFNLFILLMVIADFVFLSKDHSIKNSIFLTILWITLGISFSGIIYWMFGFDHFCEYLSAYFVEKSLSIDNIFVFLMIFSNFKIERDLQRKLLFIGIWSALILRISMIFLISGLLEHFHFAMYLFGLMIVFMGFSSFSNKNKPGFQDSLLKKMNSWTDFYQHEHHGKFFIKKNGRYKVTVLVIVVACIEICDIVFAFDSIPALFSITDDKTIIYTSNAFAIIGMRSLYIAFASIVDRFNYLKYCIGIVLIFIGVKMLISDFVHIGSGLSFCIISAILISPYVFSKKRIS